MVWGEVLLLAVTEGSADASGDFYQGAVFLQREEHIVLGTEIHWSQPVARIHGIKQLYAEFVHIDVAVLQVTCRP